MKTYFSFSGRMSRRDFWLKFNLAYMVIMFGARYLDFTEPKMGSNFGAIAFVVLIWPHLAVMTKRMHDLGWTAWVTMGMYCSALALDIASYTMTDWLTYFYSGYRILGAILGIMLGLIPGQSGQNCFGDDPLAGQRWDGSTRSLPVNDMRRGNST